MPNHNSVLRYGMTYFNIEAKIDDPCQIIAHEVGQHVVSEVSFSFPGEIVTHTDRSPTFQCDGDLFA